MKRLVALALLALTAGSANAQTWPDKPIKFIVSQAAGSTPDVIARLVADRLASPLGQQVIIENRPGAANVIGAQAAAKADADGYTFLVGTAAALASNVHTFKTLPYDPEADFTPVAMIAKGPFFLLVHPGVPAKNIAELVAEEKRNPGKLSIATEGQRNFTGIMASWLNKQAGTKMVEVPYATITQGIQDAIAGRVQVIALPITSAVPFMRSGELRAIAVSSTDPMPRFESVEPMAKTLPGVELIGWFALVAPARTDAKIVERMNKAVDAIIKSPDMQNRLADLGFYSEGAGTPQTTGAYVSAQKALWGRVIKEIDLPPQ